ncbi:MAG: nucleotidyltransferase family protein [Ancalomicrobiaceae bacterium]|nr:nucleotidyltransferase family protein [Ancalomicrobiaceae bacterium]
MRAPSAGSGAPPPPHLAFAGCGAVVQRRALEAIIRADTDLMNILTLARGLALADCWLVSGILYQTVWNALTERPARYGQKDADLVYFDASDLSYEAEDRVIRRAIAVFTDVSRPVEVRNQARVHLWYEARFGAPYAPLASATESLTRYAAVTHAVAVRLEADGSLSIEAPFGLEAIFSFRLVPNRVIDNRRTYAAKAERMVRLWPELTVEAW